MAKNKDSDSLWVLVPLAALMIPIIAVSDGNTVLVWAIAAAFVIAAGGLVGRSLMDRAHRHRLAEMEAKARLEAAERERLREANRVLDTDDRVRELRQSIRDDQPPGQEPDRLTH